MGILWAGREKENSGEKRRGEEPTPPARLGLGDEAARTSNRVPASTRRAQHHLAGCWVPAPAAAGAGQGVKGWRNTGAVLSSAVYFRSSLEILS